MVDVNIDTEFASALASVTLADGRVYPQSFPQGATFPCITYARIGTVREQAMDRTVGSRATRFQVDCWARSYAAMRQLATQVIAAVLAFFGGAVPVYGLGIDNERDDFNPETGLHRAIVEVLVTHG